jgi:hypothetical protein
MSRAEVKATFRDLSREHGSRRAVHLAAVILAFAAAASSKLIHIVCRVAARVRDNVDQAR